MIEKQTEDNIDKLISEGKNTVEISEVLKSKGLTDEQINSTVLEYNKKSLETASSIKKPNTTLTLVATLIAIVALSYLFFNLFQNN